MCLAFSAAIGGAQGPNGINLRQVASVVVPVGFEVSGAALSRDGALVFWSRESKAVRWTDGRHMRVVCAGVELDPLAAAFSETSKKIEIVDAQTGRIFQANPGGSCRVKSTIGSPGRVQAAAYSREAKQWVGLMQPGGHTVVVVKHDGRRSPLSIPRIAEQDLAATHMTASPTGLVFSSLKPPFAWRSVSWTGRISSYGRPFGSDTLIRIDSDSATNSQLFGTPVRAIDSGFIQLLSDPRGDLRVIATYGPNGRASKVSAIKLSLGLLDFEPTTKRLLALRRTDMAEIVTYSLHRPVRQARSFQEGK